MNIKALITFFVIDEYIYNQLKERLEKKLDSLQREGKISNFSTYENEKDTPYDITPELRKDHTIRIVLKKESDFKNVNEGNNIFKIEDLIIGWNLAEKKIDEQLYGYEPEENTEKLLSFMRVTGETILANPTDELKKLEDESKNEYTPFWRVFNFSRSNDYDDKRNGIDYWIDFIDEQGVRHDKVPLQVKSSLRRLHEHGKKYPTVPGISMPKEPLVESGVACIKSICNAYVHGEIFLLEIEKKKNEESETEKSLTRE